MKIMPNDPGKPPVLTNQAPNPQPTCNHASAKDLSAGPSGNHDTGDKAEISARAHEILELRQAVDAGRSVLASEPELRADKLAQARDRMASGFYHSAEVRDQVAGKLTTMFMDHPLF